MPTVGIHIMGCLLQVGLPLWSTESRSKVFPVSLPLSLIGPQVLDEQKKSFLVDEAMRTLLCWPLGWVAV